MGKSLQVADLSLAIGGKKILDDISIEIAKGSFTALCGRNGAGKSQLLKCIKGLRKPDCGRILIDGVEADAKARMKRVALVFQEAGMQIVSQSVWKDVAFGPENMGLDKDEVDSRTEAALRLMGLEDKARQRPQTLSGGELRKCAIAGILAMDPDVILLDEPFANLDYPSTLAVIRALAGLHERGYTIIAVSHEAEKFLAETDTLIILEGGRVVASGRSCDSFMALADHDIYIPLGASFGELTWLKR